MRLRSVENVTSASTALSERTGNAVSCILSATLFGLEEGLRVIVQASAFPPGAATEFPAETAGEKDPADGLPCGEDHPVFARPCRNSCARKAGTSVYDGGGKKERGSCSKSAMTFPCCTFSDHAVQEGYVRREPRGRFDIFRACLRAPVYSST